MALPADAVRRRPRRAAALLVLVAALTLVLAAAAPAAAASGARDARVVVAFLPSGGDENPKPVLERLDERTAFALGLVSATQGRFSPEQMMLDITAGERTSRAVYTPQAPPDLELVRGGDGTGFIFGWSLALARAATAPAELEPGMLAGQIPGGAAYAGVAGRTNIESVVAADRTGDVAAVSLGPSSTLAERATALLAGHRLVVVGLPTSTKGDAALDDLLRARRPSDLLVVMQAPPQKTVPVLLPIGIAGLGSNGALISPTTHLDGVVAAIDVPVTILGHLGLPVPAGVKGQPIHAEGTRDAAALTNLEARLRVVSGRRTAMLGALLFTWLGLVLALGIMRDRRGVRAGLRIGALAFLWVPLLLLFTGWLAPSRLVEVAIGVVASFALGALTDRFVRWPRGPALPAAVAIVAYAADLAAGSPLIIRSLLGANPRSGVRFYGLGNELESTLTLLLLVGLGALLWGQPRSRRGAAIIGAAGAVFAVFVGAGQLGADVGGVITVGGGIAAAMVVMAPGELSRRRVVLAATVPVAALVALAALDLATGGNGHFTRTILHADSAGSLWDVVARRYELAFNVLGHGAMPFVTLIALLGAGYAIRHRERIFAPLGGAPSWRAAFIGGLTASIVGALFNDSGPMLLAFGVFVLACTTAYVRGDPRLDDDPGGAAAGV
ncbi:MAG: hypothetical protein QOG42_2063 [Solirubrobacteraceae bacterium]|jgi:hypothetical protein|nr:hypothetical protein [Solirubrobacteraceae bacterium]